MPRVLRIINRFNLGGPTYNAAFLTRYMEDEFETLLIGGMKDESEDSSQFILENLGIQPMTLTEMRRNINPLRDVAAFRKIKKVIRDFKPDVVHTHASKSGALGRYAAHQMNVPVIVHTFHGHVFHSYFSPVKTRMYKTLERRLAGISSAIVAISEKQKRELTDVHQIAPADKVHVIPLGFELDHFHSGMEHKREKFRTRFEVADNEVAIGIVGRLVPIKNHKMFIRAVSELKQRAQNRVKGFIVGDGHERSNLEAYCSELGLSHSFRPDKDADIIFTSWIKNIDYVNAGIDIAALSSHNEGTPVSLIEAQAANRPIVSTDVGGITDIVIPGETALLSDRDNEEKFRDNLLKLVDNPGLREDMGQKGWQFVHEKFSYRRLVDDMNTLYQRLLNS